MALKPPSNTEGVVLFAQRRPDWALADLEAVHADLRLTRAHELTGEMAGQRKQCPKCSRSRALYCYDCLIPLVETPKVQLPFQLSIITHQAELASKNTGVQAYILAPGCVDLHGIDKFPNGFDADKSVVLFPSDDALTVDQLQPGSVERAIIIDSKWRKAKELLGHPALAGVRRVRLSHTKSAFWRFHTEGVAEDGVCTVEALLHLLRGMVQHNKLAPHQLPVAPSLQPLSQPLSAHVTAAEGTNTPADQQDTVPTTDAGGHDSATTGHDGQTMLGVVAPAPGVTGSADSQGGAGAVVQRADDAQLAAFHAYDDLMWFFVQQHRHIQTIAERRLAERKATRETQPAGPVVQRKKRKKGEAQQV